MCVFCNIFACRKQDNVPLTPFLTETRLIHGVFLLHPFFNNFSEKEGNWDRRWFQFYPPCSLSNSLSVSYTLMVGSRCPRLALGKQQAPPFVDYFPFSLSFFATTQSSTPKKQSLISSAPHTLLITLLFSQPSPPKPPLFFWTVSLNSRLDCSPGSRTQDNIFVPECTSHREHLYSQVSVTPATVPSPWVDTKVPKPGIRSNLVRWPNPKSLILYSSCGVATS